MIGRIVAVSAFCLILLGCGSDGDIPKDQSPIHPLGNTAPGKIQGMGDAQKIADQAQKKAPVR